MKINLRDNAKIHRQFPDAIFIRAENDRCPSCKQKGNFYSYQLERFNEREYVARDGTRMEDCGFYCTRCRWGNAGSRPVRSSQDV